MGMSVLINWFELRGEWYPPADVPPEPYPVEVPELPPDETPLPESPEEEPPGPDETPPPFEAAAGASCQGVLAEQAPENKKAGTRGGIPAI